MTPRHLHAVPATPPGEEQASKGKHIGDEMRAEILSRNWARAHVWADRQPSVSLPDVRKVRRG